MHEGKQKVVVLSLDEIKNTFFSDVVSVSQNIKVEHKTESLTRANALDFFDLL
jgi:hypothetical protein